MLVGVGDASRLSGPRGVESIRRAVAAFVRAVGHGGATAFLLPAAGEAPVADWSAAAAEAAVLTSYRYDSFPDRGGPGRLGMVIIAVAPSDAERAADGARRGARVGASVDLRSATWSTSLPAR